MSRIVEKKSLDEVNNVIFKTLICTVSNGLSFSSFTAGQDPICEKRGNRGAKAAVKLVHGGVAKSSSVSAPSSDSPRDMPLPYARPVP